MHLTHAFILVTFALVSVHASQPPRELTAIQRMQQQLGLVNAPHVGGVPRGGVAAARPAGGEVPATHAPIGGGGRPVTAQRQVATTADGTVETGANPSSIAANRAALAARMGATVNPNGAPVPRPQQTPAALSPPPPIPQQQPGHGQAVTVTPVTIPPAPLPPPINPPRLNAHERQVRQTAAAGPSSRPTPRVEHQTPAPLSQGTTVLAPPRAGPMQSGNGDRVAVTPVQVPNGPAAVSQTVTRAPPAGGQQTRPDASIRAGHGQVGGAPRHPATHAAVPPHAPVTPSGAPAHPRQQGATTVLRPLPVPPQAPRGPTQQAMTPTTLTVTPPSQGSSHPAAAPRGQTAQPPQAISQAPAGPAHLAASQTPPTRAAGATVPLTHQDPNVLRQNYQSALDRLRQQQPATGQDDVASRNEARMAYLRAEHARMMERMHTAADRRQGTQAPTHPVTHLRQNGPQ